MSLTRKQPPGLVKMIQSHHRSHATLQAWPHSHAAVLLNRQPVLMDDPILQIGDPGAHLELLRGHSHLAVGHLVEDGGTVHWACGMACALGACAGQLAGWVYVQMPHGNA